MPVSMMPQTVPDHATLPPFSTLYLTIHSAQNVQFKSNRAYCKTFVANMPMVENTMFAHFSNNQFQSFKTDIVQVDNNNPVWNAKYEIRINGPKVEVLSILVKTKQLLCCAIVGVCIINLKILIDAGHVDQWFALRKGQFQTDHLRLQMLLKKIEQPSISLRYKTDNSPEFVSTTIDKLTCGQSLNDDYCQRHEGKRDPCDQKHLERKQTSCHENDEYRQQMMKDKVSSRSSKPHESDNEAEIFDEELGFEVDQEGGNNKESAEQKPRSEGSEDLNSQRSHTSYKSINSNQLSCKQINGTHTAQQARSPSSEVLCGMKQSTVENLLAESRQVDQDFTHDKRLESSASESICASTGVARNSTKTFPERILGCPIKEIEADFGHESTAIDDQVSPTSRLKVPKEKQQSTAIDHQTSRLQLPKENSNTRNNLKKRIDFYLDHIRS